MNAVQGQGDPSEMNQQDPRIRRAVRQEYKELIKETVEKRGELSNYKNVEQLQELVQRTNNVYQRVGHTREAALDSKLMADISQLTVEALRGLPVGLANFTPSDFAAKIKTQLGEGEEESISHQGWIKLGQSVAPMFKRSPPLKLMLGSFQRDPPQPKEPKQRKGQQVDEDSEEVTKPKQVQHISELGRKEQTTEEVDYVLIMLRKLYEIAHRKPICYFEFITDPDSFGHTIENMFHVSFLVKDGHCRIFLDEDELPVIEPNTPETDEERGQELAKKQVIMTLTQDDWKDIVDTFGITEAVLQTRKDKAVSGGNLQDSDDSGQNSVQAKKKR